MCECPVPTAQCLDLGFGEGPGGFPFPGNQMGLISGLRPLSSFLFLSQLPSKALVPEMEDEDEEDDSEDAINEFDFLGSGEDGEGSPDPRRCASEGNPHELGEFGTD